MPRAEHDKRCTSVVTLPPFWPLGNLSPNLRQVLEKPSNFSNFGLITWIWGLSDMRIWGLSANYVKGGFSASKPWNLRDFALAVNLYQQHLSRKLEILQLNFNILSLKASTIGKGKVFKSQKLTAQVILLSGSYRMYFYWSPKVSCCVLAFK